MERESSIGVGILLRARDGYRLLAAKRFLVILVFLIGIVVTLAFTFQAKRFYTATTVIMPPVQQGSSINSLAQFGAVAGFSTGMLGGKTPDELYGALVKSRSVLDALISRFGLKDIYKQSKAADLREILMARIGVNIDKKSGLITVSVDDYEPKRSAEMANALVSELRVLLSRVAITEAQQKTKYFENQVLVAQRELEELERTFSQQNKKNGSRVIELNAEIAMKAAVDIRKQISEVKIKRAMLARVRATHSEELMQLNTQIEALERALKDAERGVGWTDNNETSSETVNGYKKIRVKVAVLETLMRQLEAAKIEEAKEGPLIQQIDVAVVPEYPSKPRRLWLLLTGIFASCIAVVAAIWLESVWKGYRDECAKL